MQEVKSFKETLDRCIKSSQQIFVIPHLGADFDAISSCIAMYLIADKFKIPCYIIIDEDSYKIESGVKLIIDETKDKISYINMDTYENIKSSNDLLIMCDVNKKNMICCKECINQFKDIIIIDHHNEDFNTVSTKNKYINPSISSTCEFMVELLGMYSIKYSSDIANYLLAGIYLDTNRFSKNISSKTMKMVSKLMEKKADISIVNDYFIEDFVSDRKVQELVNKADFYSYNIAMCIASEEDIYTKEELAKVSDYLLRYRVDAAISAGYIDKNIISISARSKGKIDVGKIMGDIGGGGNSYSAASRIYDEKLENVAKKLEKTIKPNFYK